MQPITITTMLDENHELFLKVKLPDLPPGPVEVVITPRPAEDAETTQPQSRREQLRAKLRQAGLLAEPVLTEAEHATIQELSTEERERLWKQAAGGKTALELVNEEREERF